MVVGSKREDGESICDPLAMPLQVERMIPKADIGGLRAQPVNWRWRESFIKGLARLGQLQQTPMNGDMFPGEMLVLANTPHFGRLHGAYISFEKSLSSSCHR